MPNKQYEQHDFGVGEISPDHTWRAELEIRGRSLKTATNVRILASGAAASRPGTTRLSRLINGDGQVVDVTIGATVYMLVLTAERLDVWNKATRTLVQTLTGLAWTLPIVTRLTVAPHGSRAYVFYSIIRPQVIERSPAGVWSVTPYAFGTGIGGARSQPHHRFADPGVTLTPSALTGSITLTASSAYFLASGHVGLRFRLQGREVEISGYTSPTVVSATVIQPLLPTRILTLDTTAGFEVGEVVEGKDSTAKGEVVEVTDATHITVLMLTFTDFYYNGAGTPPGEKVIGRNAVGTTTAATSITTNAAVLDWTEQAMSGVRGWPGTGAVHRNRLFMARFENIPFAIAASAVGDFTDFEAGANDADAIFEELGDEGTGIIQHIVSAEQLLVLTSRLAFYYPESEANPIKPTGFSLLQIGPVGASNCRPAQIAEGVLFGSAAGGAVQGAFPTGDVRRSWRTAEMSRLSAHLIKHPRAIAYVAGHEDADPGDDAVLSRTVEYAYAVNESGSMAVVAYTQSEADAIPGWTRWTTAGEFRWATANEGECWAIVARTHAGIAEVWYALEVFESTRLVDSAVDIGPGDLQGAATTETILTPSGPMDADFVYRCAALSGATVSLVIGGDYIGEVSLDADGDFGVPDIAGAIQVGFGFASECVPWPPMDAEDERARRRKRRISRAHVRYQGKGMAIDGTLRPLHDGGEDTSAAGPLRDELYSKTCFGWSHEPTVSFAKPFAAPWLMLGYSFEVAS